VNKRWLLSTFAALPLALACTSCGSSTKLYPVSGKVIYKDSPAQGAVVFFHRRGADPLNEQTIMGIVQEDGSFTLVCGPHGPGAPPGEYDVLIQWKRSSNSAKGVAHKAPDWLKGRYFDLKHPLLHAVVKAETNDLRPFELTD
jgi:hypothetical protein